VDRRRSLMGAEHVAVSDVDSTTPRESRIPPGWTSDEVSVELSSRRTGMSFQRTRMSADRTLMSVIRTSLSLIGFGFTIFQFFQKMHDAQILKSSDASRHFGQALVWLGIAMLVVGIGYHVLFMLGLRAERQDLKGEGLIHAESRFPVSLTLMVAVLLLLIGIMAIVSMTRNSGPFG
jgi:putative membrane protein